MGTKIGASAALGDLEERVPASTAFGDQDQRVPASTAFGDNKDQTGFTDSPAGEIQGADRENTLLLMSEPMTLVRTSRMQ